MGGGSPSSFGQVVMTPVSDVEMGPRFAYPHLVIEAKTIQDHGGALPWARVPKRRGRRDVDCEAWAWLTQRGLRQLA